MKLVHYEEAGDFWLACRHLLEAAEAQNNVVLGLRRAILDHPERLAAPPWLLAVVDDGGAVIGAAVRTPPNPLALALMPDQAAVFLAEALAAETKVLPAVGGASPAPKSFAARWAQLVGCAARPVLTATLYQFRGLKIPAPAAEKLRRFWPEELDLLASWVRGFFAEVNLEDLLTPEVRAQRYIADGRAWFWEDRGPVAMATFTGDTPNGVRVSLVFTPRELRGRGYATACVAALSQRALDSGKRFCFLLADQSNPISNAVYLKVGYEPVGDFQEWRFEYPE